MASRSRVTPLSGVLFLVGDLCGLGPGQAAAAQLTATWVDNSGGTATTRIERRLETQASYAAIADVPPGGDDLLRLLHHVVYDFRRPKFYAVLIGDGDSRTELEALTYSLGVADRVWFTGFIPDEDMLRYLSTADNSLDPNPSSSLNDVSMRIKVMEYMALGKPIVSLDLKETRLLNAYRHLFGAVSGPVPGTAERA